MGSRRKNSQSSQGSNPVHSPPPQHNTTPSRSSTRSSHSDTSRSNPSAQIRGAHFAGASGLLFDGKNKFRNHEGDYDESSDEEGAASTTHERSRRATSRAHPVPEQWAPGTVVDGEFFAGASNAVFAGKNEFITASQGNKSRHHDSSSHTSSTAHSQSRHDGTPTEGLHISGQYFAGLRGGTFTGENKFTSVNGDIRKHHSKGSSRASQDTSQAGAQHRDYYPSHASTTSYSSMPRADYPDPNGQRLGAWPQNSPHASTTSYASMPHTDYPNPNGQRAWGPEHSSPHASTTSYSSMPRADYHNPNGPASLAAGMPQPRRGNTVPLAGYPYNPGEPYNH
ncbi:hypothetical protein BT96DRAFT_921912, partial [Gymnopus androsaceus JB14]